MRERRRNRLGPPLRKMREPNGKTYSPHDIQNALKAGSALDEYKVTVEAWKDVKEG